jgi:hypothetical protein
MDTSGRPEGNTKFKFEFKLESMRFRVEIKWRGFGAQRSKTFDSYTAAWRYSRWLNEHKVPHIINRL